MNDMSVYTKSLELTGSHDELDPLVTTASSRRGQYSSLFHRQTVMMSTEPAGEPQSQPNAKQEPNLAHSALLPSSEESTDANRKVSFITKVLTYLMTASLCMVYIVNRLLILLFFLFTWQWFTDDERTRNTPEHPMRRYWFIALWAWSAVELVFYAYQWWLEWTIRRMKPNPPPLDPQMRRQLLQHTWEHISDPYTFISRWFLQTPHTELGKENCLEWLAWAFFGKHIEHLEPEERDELHSITKDLMEGIDLKEGKSYSAKSMRHNIDPISILPRPLAAYVFVFLTQCLLEMILYVLGFRYMRVGCVQSWIRRPPKTIAERPESPLIFIHGLSLGLLPYVFFFTGLRWRYPRRTLVILHLKHLTNHFPSRRVPTRAEVVADIEEVCRRLKLAPAVWSGHSFGTIICTWILKNLTTRPLVKRMALVDPVCFQMWEPDLVHNFGYRKPETWCHYIIRHILAGEPSIAASIKHHFWWYECVLLPDQLPEGTRVFLSSEDIIINANKVHAYLSRHNVVAHVFDGFQHADYVTSVRAMRMILDAYDEL